MGITSAAAAAILLALSAVAAVNPDVDFIEVPLGQAEVPDEEWQAFLRDNLWADLARWRAQPPLRSNYTLMLYDKLMADRPLPAVLKVALVYNNRLYWPRHKGDGQSDGEGGLPHPASPYKEAFHRKIGHLLSSGRLQLPNMVFVFNSDDNRGRWCGPDAGCPVPLISMFKTVGTREGNDTDILIPQFLFSNNEMYSHPWHLKKDVAFFRGSPYCSGYWHWKVFTCSRACPRTYLSYRSHVDARQRRTPAVLDVGLTQPMFVAQGAGAKQCVPYNDVPPTVPRVPLGNHSYYKWLLHLEGYSASCRLSQLLMTNSLVLFQQQPFLEYYYRSLQPWVHYAPFWNVTSASPGNSSTSTGNGGMDDVYDVVQQLREWDERDPAAVQRIIQRAQTFALKFTSAAARVRYLRDALLAYRSLFGDMDAFVGAYVARLRAEGMDIR